MKRIIALVIAVLVHALTLAFVVLGGWTIVANSASALGWLGGGILAAVGWVLRPRLGGLPADAEPLTRTATPELYGAADRVADRIGVKRPARVMVSELAMDTRYARSGPLRGPVLVVGLPAWLALSPRLRVALLARAYANTATGEELAVRGALSTLAEWRAALAGSQPLEARDDAQTKIAASSLGGVGHTSTGYEALSLLGRIIGRVLVLPVLAVEYLLARLSREGEGRAQERRRTRASRAATPAELTELEDLLATGRYVAPMQAAALRGESVPSIRQSAVARSLRAENGALVAPPGSELLGAGESDRIDDELLGHYTRAIRSFGLIT